jgi:hypothetical protein
VIPFPEQTGCIRPAHEAEATEIPVNWRAAYDKLAGRLSQKNQGFENCAGFPG